jgi:hypothetical protein
MAPQTISPEGAADAEGPNASMAFGAVGQAQTDANSLKSTNPAAYAGSQEPGAGGPQAGPQGPPPGQAPPTNPTQPPPNPGPKQSGPDISDHPNLEQGEPWRARLNTWAAAGDHPYLQHFADMANRNANLRNHGK